MEKNIVKGLTYGILSALFGAYPYILFNVAFRSHEMTTEFFCLTYHFCAVIYLLGYFVGNRRLSALRFPPATYLSLALLGILEFFSVYALFSAMKIMDPTLVSFFNNSQTVFIILLGAFILRERFNRMESLGTLVALFGVFLISYRSGSPERVGLALTVTSALLFSCTVILIKKKLIGYSAMALAFYRALFITVCFAAVCLCGSVRPPARVELLTPIAAAALFGPFLNILFYFGALRHLDASKASLIRAIQPVFVLVNAFFLLGMSPLPIQLVGGFVIIFGLWVLVKGREKAGA